MTVDSCRDSVPRRCCPELRRNEMPIGCQRCGSKKALKLDLAFFQDDHLMGGITGRTRALGISPRKLQCKLDLTGTRVCQSNLTTEGNWVPELVDDAHIVSRRPEVRPIEDVEKLRSELHIEVLRNPLGRNVLEQRKVVIDQPRTNQRVTPLIAEQSTGVWGREALDLDILIGISGIHIGGAAGRYDPIGILPGVRVVHPKRISGNCCGKRQARLDGQDTPSLPTTQDRLRRRSERGWSRDLPDVINRQIVFNIGVGETAPAFPAKVEKARD